MMRITMPMRNTVRGVSLLSYWSCVLTLLALLFAAGDALSALTDANAGEVDAFEPASVPSGLPVDD